jgi:hypothetical protein
MMPAMRGAAHDVPEPVQYVARSVDPGPFSGLLPTAWQTPKYTRHAEMMPSPGAERSGHVAGSLLAPRAEVVDTVPPLSIRPLSSYEAMLSTPRVRCSRGR